MRFAAEFACFGHETDPFHNVKQGCPGKYATYYRPIHKAQGVGLKGVA